MCTSAQQGIESINAHKPDDLLDIEMPRMNGFDMLEQFDNSFDVVFVQLMISLLSKPLNTVPLIISLSPLTGRSQSYRCRGLKNANLCPARNNSSYCCKTSISQLVNSTTHSLDYR
jgi:two-component system LytT family response regulator